MRMAMWWVVASLVTGCLRELGLPASSNRPGSLRGALVYSVAGRAAPEPARGARVEVLGATLATQANADGFFYAAGPDPA
jgi:hypothetical protein